MINYGLSYQGSKNKIATKIANLLPPAANLYDLFAGGCAVTHAAMLTDKWQHFVVNDINETPALFVAACNGAYKSEERWISREDFERLKGTDCYVAVCWSFGNNAETYMYSKEIEPWKRAFHFATVFRDYAPAKEFGLDLSFIDGICDAEGRRAVARLFIRRNIDEIKKRYIKWFAAKYHNNADIEEQMRNLEANIKHNEEELRNYLVAALKESGLKASDVDKHLGTCGMAGHYFGRSQWEFPTYDAYCKMQEILPLPLAYDEVYGLQELLESLQRLERLQSLERLQRLERLERLQRLQSLQRLERLQSLERLERLQSLESLQRLQRLERSYDAVEIAPDSVIYCDIPYIGTAGYNGGGFDHAKFYEWAKAQEQPCFISEYTMPVEDFVCIKSYRMKRKFSAQVAQDVTEGVFVPRVQIERGIVKQSPLWDYKGE